MPREKLTHLADYLRALTHARPELIVAEDTRPADGDFTLRYIFALERAAELVDRFGQRPGHGPDVSLARDAVVSRQPLRARDS